MLDSPVYVLLQHRSMLLEGFALHKGKHADNIIGQGSEVLCTKVATFSRKLRRHGALGCKYVFGDPKYISASFDLSRVLV